jgi:hypothetical protein
MKMSTPITNTELNKDSQAFNASVKQAFFAILKHAKQLLSSLKEEPMRYTLSRKDKPTSEGYIVHELVSPLLYLRLECHKDGNLSIRYGCEMTKLLGQYHTVTSSFIRLVYKLTMADATPVDIEHAVKTDFVITECLELYEYIDERWKSNHDFKMLPYKVKSAKKRLGKEA